MNDNTLSYSNKIASTLIFNTRNSNTSPNTLKYKYSEMLHLNVLEHEYRVQILHPCSQRPTSPRLTGSFRWRKYFIAKGKILWSTISNQTLSFPPCVMMCNAYSCA